MPEGSVAKKDGWAFITVLPKRGWKERKSLKWWMVSLKCVCVSEATLKCPCLTDPDLTQTLSTCVDVCGLWVCVHLCVHVSVWPDFSQFIFLRMDNRGLSYLSPSVLVRLSMSACSAGKQGGIFSTVKASSYKQWLSSDRRYGLSSSLDSRHAFSISV